MGFNIEALIWVVPGLVGLWAYNSILTCKMPQPDGWKHLLSVAFFALPYYFFIKHPALTALLSSWISSVIEPIPIITVLVNINANVAVVLYSTVTSALLGVLIALARNIIHIKRSITSDPFHDSCTSWKKKLVFITLKSNKVYLGLLMDYTKVTGFEYTIKIMPVYSGYRDNTQKVQWTFEYPNEKRTLVELVIAKSEISSFALWNNSPVFENLPDDALTNPYGKLELKTTN